MAIPIITRTNTIDEWRVQTNQGASALNSLETGTYTKSNGTLALTGNSALVITANGTALQVANGALFQSNVTINKDVSIGTQTTAVGNVTIGGITTLVGPGSALQVANNALVNTDLQVTRTVYTGNIAANGNVTVGGNETVSGILRLNGTGDVLYVNTGVAKVNTATITDLTSTNATVSYAEIADEVVDNSYVVIGTTLRGNVVNLTTTTANVETLNVVTGVTLTGNVVNLSSDVAQVNTANIIGVTVSANAYINKLTVNTTANVTQDLGVTANIYGGNVTTTGTTRTGSFVSTGSANIGGSAFVTSNVEGNNLVIAGHSQTATLRTSGVANVGSGLSVTGTATITGNTSTTNIVNSQHIQTATLRTSGVANVGNGLTVSGNTITTDIVNSGLIHSANIRTSGSAAIGVDLTVANTLVVTGNTTSGNVNTANLVHAGAVRTTGRADIGGALQVTGATTLSTGQVTGNFSVAGDFTINGNTVYNTNQMILSVASPNQTTTFGTYRTNNSLSLANSVAQNAFVRWNESQKYWDLSTDPANNVIYQILDSGRLSSDLTNTSATIIATASAANTLNTRIVTANTNLKAYTDGLVTTANNNLQSYLNANITLLAASSNSYTDTSVTNANTSLKLYVDGEFANLNANIVSANTNTYSYLSNTFSNISSEIVTANSNLQLYVDGKLTDTNSYIASSNTKLKAYTDGTLYAKTGGTISGDVVITGNLTTQGSVTYVNSTQVQVGDNIITLNSDVPGSTTPSEDAGLEINRGSSTNTRILWNESIDKWTFTNDGTTYSQIASAAAESYANSAYARANASSQLFSGTSGSASPSSGTLTFASNNGVTLTGSGSTITVSTSQDLRTSASPTFNSLGLTNALALAQGGTGATSAAAALNNLMPSGQVAGYVLTTGGVGSYYWSPGGTGGGGGTQPGTRITSTRLSSTATGNGQVTWTTPTFSTGTQLRAYINGVRQFESEYSANSTANTITFTTSPQNGDNILLEVDGYAVYEYYANNIVFTAPVGSIPSSANTIQLAIQDLESRKAATTGATFTGQTVGLTVDTNASNTSFATTAFVKNALNQSGNTFSHSISGNAGTVTNGVYTSGNQTIGGTKTFSSTISGSIDGNAGTVTNGVYTNGSYSNPSWITSIASTKVSGLASSATTDTTNASNISSGTLNASRLPYSMNQGVSTSSGVQFSYLGVGVAATGTSGEIVASGTITAGYSDDNLKTKLGNIESALEKLTSLNGFYFEPNQTAQDLGYEVKREVGVSAQEVQKVLPEVVVPAPIDDKYLTVKYEKLVPLLIEAIKELKTEVDALKGIK